MFCSFDTSLVIKVANFAVLKHRNQHRKDADASPYINHPLALANVLSNEADITDPAVIWAALLHDTIEDTETTLEELQAEFGKVIASVVLARLRWIPHGIPAAPGYRSSTITGSAITGLKGYS